MNYTYIIWSFQHKAWWRADSLGYTVKIEEAGEYSYNEALERMLGANWMFRDGIIKPDAFPDEAMIPIKKKFVIKEQ